MSPHSSLDRRFSINGFVAIGAVLAAAVIGYVVGREHVKYEIRSALWKVGEAISKSAEKALSGGSIASDVPSAKSNGQPSPKKPSPKPVTAKDPPKELKIRDMVITPEYELALIEARVDIPKIDHDRSTANRERKLILTFHVKNRDRRKVMMFMRESMRESNHFELVDDVANTVHGVSLGFWDSPVGALRKIEEILPEQERTHVELFEVPLPRTEHLILTVNRAAVGGNGKVKYKIAADEIEGFKRE